jgi:hypothetical protein
MVTFLLRRRHLIVEFDCFQVLICCQSSYLSILEGRSNEQEIQEKEPDGLELW